MSDGSGLIGMGVFVVLCFVFSIDHSLREIRDELRKLNKKGD